MPSADLTVKAVAWLAFAIQIFVGAAVFLGAQGVPRIALLNFIVGACVLVYWGQRWFGYLFHGITWYATDQLMPACALLVCVLAALSLSGRYPGVAAQWLIFIVDTLALLAAALFLTFVRFTRLF